MIKNRMAKIAALTVGMTFALSLSVDTAGAVTIAELQAQINALMAQLAALQGTTVTTSAAITSDLTVGSTGAQVVALQSALVAQGHLVMPAGVAMGYFGSLTRAAVMKWQAANGVPATGYFGPLSRAKFNASGGATGTVPGTTIGGTVSVGVITTPGVEGTLTASLNPSPASGTKLYENDMKKGVLGLKLEAKTSDIKVERIKLDLDVSAGGGVDTDLFRKIAQKVYIMDGSTVLGSMDLNNSTVVEDGSDWFITVAGLSYVVPKDSTRVLTVALDARATWDSAFDTDTWTIGVPAEGIRGVDGAGVNQYAPATAFSRNFTSEGDILDDATLEISTASDTPQDQEVICTQNADEDECDGLELLKANFRANKDAVTLTDLVVDINMTSGDTATATTAYLYDGSTLVGSAVVFELTGANSAHFNDIDYVIPKDTTKKLTVKVDVQDTDADDNIFTADIDTADATAENSAGTALTESGSAQGESVGVRKVGLEYTLVSKNVTYTAAAGFVGATSTAKADFKVRITARGSAVEFGDTASTTYAFADQDSTLSADESIVIYRGGAAVNPDVSSSTAMTIGSGVTAVAGSLNSWILGEGNSVDIDVSYVMETRDDDAYTLITTGAYAFGLERLNWLTLSDGRQTSTFMAESSAWRTDTVTLP